MENQKRPRRLDQIGTRAFAIDKSRRFQRGEQPKDFQSFYGERDPGAARILRRHERKPPSISKENQNLQWIRKRRPKSVRQNGQRRPKGKRIRRRLRSDMTFNDFLKESVSPPMRRMPRQNHRRAPMQPDQNQRKRRIVGSKREEPSLAIPSDKEIRDILLQAGAFTKQGEPSHPPTSGDPSPKKLPNNMMTIGGNIGEPSSVSRSRVRSLSEEPGARLTSAERIFRELRGYHAGAGGEEIPVLDIPEVVDIIDVKPRSAKRKREPHLRLQRPPSASPGRESDFERRTSVVGIDGIGFAQSYVERNCDKLTEREIESFLKKKGLTQAEINTAWRAVRPGKPIETAGAELSLSPSSSEDSDTEDAGLVAIAEGEARVRSPRLPVPMSPIMHMDSAEFREKMEKVTGQRRFTRFNSREDSQKLDGDELQLHLVIKELIQTEKSYVEQLRKINSEFLSPLREKGFIKPNSEVGRMEIIVNELIEGQAWFLKCLLKAESILDVFLLPRASKLFKTYSSYVDVYKNWSEALARMRRVKKIRKFLDTLVPPDTLFLTPVQRPPRYLLLLQQMKKKTPSDHPKYQDLLTTIDQVKLLVQYTNSINRAPLRRILSIRIAARQSTNPELKSASSYSSVPDLSLAAERECLMSPTTKKIDPRLLADPHRLPMSPDE